MPVLVPRPGIEPVLPAFGAQSLNHQCARETPAYEPCGALWFVAVVTRLQSLALKATLGSESLLRKDHHLCYHVPGGACLLLALPTPRV